MIKNPAFYFNSELCTGCKACMTSCFDRNNLEVPQKFRKVYEFGGGEWKPDEAGAFTATAFTYYVSMTCGHCENPACVANCPTGAMQKDPETGIVNNDKEKCIGCQFCAMACPYGVRYLNEEERVVEKCTLCQQRTAQGELPQCVAQCGSRARFFGDLDEGLESFQALAPTHDLATPYEEMMQNRTTLGEWVEPFTEADVYHLTDTGNGPKHCYILRNRKWQGEE